MTLAVLLAVASPQMSQDDLARSLLRDLQPYVEIHARSGSARLPDGKTVALVGICDSQKGSAPWDADGRPLDKNRRAKFESLSGYELAKRPWAVSTPLGEQGARVAVFEVTAPTNDGVFAFLDLPAGLLSLSEGSSVGRLQGLAARRFTAHIAVPDTARVSHWSVLMLGHERPLGKVREENPTPIHGLGVTIKAKSPEPISVYVNGRRESLSLVEYTIILEAPAALEEQNLSVDTKEPSTPPVPSRVLAREYTGSVPAAKPGFRNFLFRVEGLQQEGFDRQFSFSARSMARVQFRNLPMIGRG